VLCARIARNKCASCSMSIRLAPRSGSAHSAGRYLIEWQSTGSARAELPIIPERPFVSISAVILHPRFSDPPRCFKCGQSRPRNAATAYTIKPARMMASNNTNHESAPMVRVLQGWSVSHLFLGVRSRRRISLRTMPSPSSKRRTGCSVPRVGFWGIRPSAQRLRDGSRDLL
jgi:hypothetical protein